jgi:cell division protein FtsI/penicillin-binding protein 2
VDAEDLDVRRAAVAALGPFNGTVVVVDSGTGRVLSMVHQKVALSSGFQPCSTIKVSVALAALSEKIIEPASKLRVKGLGKMDLTYALAHSNNLYFSTVGEHLGFQKVSYYAHLFGYGEKAGLNIAGEQPGHYPSAPPRNGGVGMLTSFGEEIQQTPLELAALLSAVANGGTLYYLQYPRTAAEAANLVPRVKRRLDIGQAISVIEPGMRGAVDFGTAHRAREDAPIAGKTGTCSDESSRHLGWFGSYNETGKRKLVVVVLLTGGRPAIGPLAAGIAGDVYRRLDQEKYFAREESKVAAPSASASAPSAPANDRSASANARSAAVGTRSASASDRSASAAARSTAARSTAARSTAARSTAARSTVTRSTARRTGVSDGGMRLASTPRCCAK